MMQHDFLSCEKCKAELTRQTQKQHVDKQGFVHSFCAKCFETK